MNTINSCLSASIRAHEQRTFLIRPSTERLTYGEFDHRLARVATLLDNLGVRPGDRVALVGSNSIDFAVMLYGTIVAGAVGVPLNPNAPALELQNLVQHAHPKAIFAEPQVARAGLCSTALPLSTYRYASPSSGSRWGSAVDSSTPALLMHTSGTTSIPKGILLTHGNLACNTRAAVDRLRLQADHMAACILPLHHMFAIVSDLSSMALCGGSTVLLDTFQLERLQAFESAMHEFPVNSFSAAPLMFELMLRFGCRLRTPHLRFCISGAAPLKDSTIAEFRSTYGVEIIPAYGLTETTCFATLSPPGNARAGSCGFPAGVEMRVASETGESLADREIGEIQVSGASVMPGAYLDGAGDCFHENGTRWFKTGDLGYRDAEGYYYITGRKKNMVIRGGEKVFLEDLDVCLQSMPGVEDAATVRIDVDGEERVASVVVLASGSGIQIAQIEQWLAERVGPLKSPDLVLLSDMIPRTPTNKVKVMELQQHVLRSAVPV